MTVRDLTGAAAVIAGKAGLGKRILSPQIHVIDLDAPATWKELASRVVQLRPQQAAVLCSLPPRERVALVRTLLQHKPACVVVTGGASCPELVRKADSLGVPLLKCGNVAGIRRILVDRLVPRISLHGVLVQIFELGTLLIGESAVGKSEAALDLVLRGHKLTADDMVILERKSSEILGRPTELGADLLQIRGLGIINVRALYGESATVEASRIGLVVELEEWQKGHQYTLVGLRERRYRLLGVNIPYLKLPVKPGRNMATLIEVAARNQILKNRGIYTARDLNKKLLKRLSG